MQTYLEILKYSIIISTSLQFLSFLLQSFGPMANSLKRHFAKINQVIAKQDLYIDCSRGWLTSKRTDYHVRMAKFPLTMKNLITPSFFIQAIILGPIQVLITAVIFLMTLATVTQKMDQGFEVEQQNLIMQLENGISSGRLEQILISHLQAMCDDSSYDTQRIYYEFLDGHHEAKKSEVA